jgi:hypothetical protein
MADKKEKKCKCGDFSNFSVNKAENGYKISACFEKKNKSLSERAGWCPTSGGSYKEYVATSKPEMFNRLEKIMGGDCGCDSK